MRRASLTDVYLTSGRYICFFWVFYFLYLFFLPLKHTAEQNGFVVYLLVPSILAFPPCLVKSWWFHHVPRCWRTLGTNVNPAWEPLKKKVQIYSTTTVPVWWWFKNFESCKFISRAVLKHSGKQWVFSKAINVPKEHEESTCPCTTPPRVSANKSPGAAWARWLLTTWLWSGQTPALLYSHMCWHFCSTHLSK